MDLVKVVSKDTLTTVLISQIGFTPLLLMKTRNKCPAAMAVLALFSASVCIAKNLCSLCCLFYCIFDIFYILI